MSATIAFDPIEITPVWQAFKKVLPIPLAPIRNERQYQKMLLLLNNLIDTVGDNQKHALSDFLDLVGQLIEDYENEHHEIPNTQPQQVLHFLMEHHEMKQSDLATELGSQSIVSEILSGKRAINARQAKTLAFRFGVSPAVFI